MRDPFSYSARWDSVGLDCSFCIHEEEVSWPNTERNYSCKLHGIPLAAVINKQDYKEGEWFCHSFASNGNANSRAVYEFKAVRGKLSQNTLYGAYGENENLKEIPFNEL